jgi:hypothetical protein
MFKPSIQLFTCKPSVCNRVLATVQYNTTEHLQAFIAIIFLKVLIQNLSLVNFFRNKDIKHNTFVFCTLKVDCCLCNNNYSIQYRNGVLTDFSFMMIAHFFTVGRVLTQNFAF